MQSYDYVLKKTMKENPNTCSTIFVQKLLVSGNTDTFKIENAFQFNFGRLVSNLEMSHLENVAEH